MPITVLRADILRNCKWCREKKLYMIKRMERQRFMINWNCFVREKKVTLHRDRIHFSPVLHEGERVGAQLEEKSNENTRIFVCGTKNGIWWWMGGLLLAAKFESLKRRESDGFMQLVSNRNCIDLVRMKRGRTMIESDWYAWNLRFLYLIGFFRNIFIGLVVAKCWSMNTINCNGCR